MILLLYYENLCIILHNKVGQLFNQVYEQMQKNICNKLFRYILTDDWDHMSN